MARVIEYRTPLSRRRYADAIPMVPGDSYDFDITLSPSDAIYSDDPPAVARDDSGEVAALLRWLAVDADLLRHPYPTPKVGVNPNTQIAVHGLPIDDFHGWPMKSMMSTAYYAHGYPFLVVNGIELKPAASPSWKGVLETYRGLPLKPLWPEFAVNTAVYAAGLVTVFASIRLAKRLWRRKHHRCTACGYDLRGQTESGCPECGVGRGEGATRRVEPVDAG